MNCHQTRQLVSAYSDQELTGQQMLEIREHLQHCPTCAREWQEINDVRRLLRSLSSPTPQRSAEEKITACLDTGAGPSLADLTAFFLNGTPTPWGEPFSLGRRPPSRRTAYAFALASVVVLAVAAPFAPSTGDAAGTVLVTDAQRFQFFAPQPPQNTSNTLIPLLRLTGTANAIEADPFHDDAIGGYVRSDATLASLQTSDDGAR